MTGAIAARITGIHAASSTRRNAGGFFGSLYGLSGAALDATIASGLDFVGLGERARDKVKTFSGGMKRRLNLVAAADTR